MRMRGGCLGMLVIAICGIILLLSGFYAIVFFEHTHVSVPLTLIVVVCAAIIAGTIRATSKARR